MTFKHVKFEDSAVMRSLEKVAHQKGLIKKEDLVKTAAVKTATDLTPSNSLTLNIIKLCSGLREQGFNTHAEDLEAKFGIYKNAQTLYEAFKEKGEDLVDEAHPKGSHKLEDVDGDSIFETILDQQLKDLEVVNKKPTGKLSSSKEILESVKMVLGESFLENGGANNSRKIAQETSPATSSSSVGTEVAETAGVMGGLALLKYVYTKMKAAKALDAQAIKWVEEQMARKLTNAEAQGITKALIESNTKKAVELFGEKAAQNIAKSVGTEIAKDVGGAVVKEVGSTVIKEVGSTAAKSGLWSRIVPWLSEAGTVVAEMGAADVAAGGGAVAGTAALALLAAVIAGGTTWMLFNKYQEPTELKEAGDLLIESADNLSADLPIEARRAIANFKDSYNKVLANYSVIKELQENKNPHDLLKLQQLHTALSNSNKQAQIIWSYAQDALDKQWYNPRGILGGYTSGLVTKSNNYMNRSMTLIQLINNLLVDLVHKIEETTKANKDKAVAAKGGPEVQNLFETYNNMAKDIKLYMDKIHAKRIPNEKPILSWLKDMIEYLLEEAKDFNTASNKKDVVPEYLSRFNNEFKPRIDAFKEKAIKEGWL